MIRIFNHYVSKMAFILLVLDVLMLLATASVASALWGDSGQRRAGHPYLSPLAFTLVIVFGMSALGMYQHSARDGMRTTLLRIVPSFGLGLALLGVAIAVRPELYLGHAVSGVIVALGAAAVLLTRLLVFTSAGLAPLGARLLFIGSGVLARQCMDLALGTLGCHQVKVLGCISVDDEHRAVPATYVLPMGESLLTMAQTYEASEIVVTVSNRRGRGFPVEQLLECALGGVRVIDAATFFEREACQIRLDSLQPSYLIFGGGFKQSVLRATTKRAFDLAASTLISIAGLPLMLLAALAIVLDDGAPVFYQQERVGRHGRLFEVLKFRSMRNDAESDGVPTWASANDPRVTRVGRLLRKLRIDELPQMVNVLRGDMSLVGPRPERAYFVDQLVEQVAYYKVRHSIKPGVTGLAQVRYQYGASVDDAIEKLQYDLYYVKNNSLFLDLLILVDTVQVVLLGKGGR